MAGMMGFGSGSIMGPGKVTNDKFKGGISNSRVVSSQPMMTVTPNGTMPQELNIQHSKPKHDWGGNGQDYNPHNLGTSQRRKAPGF